MKNESSLRAIEDGAAISEFTRSFILHINPEIASPRKNHRGYWEGHPNPTVATTLALRAIEDGAAISGFTPSFKLHINPRSLRLGKTSEAIGKAAQILRSRRR